jgi:gluconate 2-dehydrogenase subunit 3-like protein
MPRHSRRDLLKRTAGALLAVPLLRPTSLVALPDEPLLFFDLHEFHMVDELSELILPADDHSPGARAAKVAAYIDQRLGESFETEPRRMWRDGLKRIDALSKEMHGRSFLDAPPGERIVLLERLAAREANPQVFEEIFFKELKARTLRAYYTSEVGIHREMQYKGNTYLEEFSGFDAK